MTKASRFTYNFIVNSISTGISVFLGVIIIPFLIFHLGEAKYGLTVLFSSLFGFAALVETGVNTAIIRKLSICASKNDYEDFNRTFSFSMNIGVLITFIFTAVSAIFSKQILSVFSQIPPDIFPLAQRAMWICILNSSITAFILPVILALFSTKHRFDIIALIRASIICVQVLLWYMVLSYTDLNFMGWVVSTLVVTAVISLGALTYGIYITPFFKYNFVYWHNSFFSDIFVIAAKSSIIKIADFSMTYANPILFSIYGSIIMNTIFQTASKGATVLYMIMINLSSQTIPHLAGYLANKNLDGIAKMYVSTARIIFSVSALFFVFMLSNYKYIFHCWLESSMPENWLTVGNVFIWLLLIQTILMPTDFQRTILTVINRINETTVFYVLKTVFVLAIVVYMLKFTSLGVFSVVVAHLPVALISVCFYGIYLKRYIKVPISKQFLHIFGRGIVFIFAASAIILLARQFVDALPCEALAKFFVNSAFDCAVLLPLLWFGGFAASDRQRIIDSLPFLRKIKAKLGF